MLDCQMQAAEKPRNQVGSMSHDDSTAAIAATHSLGVRSKGALG